MSILVNHGLMGLGGLDINQSVFGSNTDTNHTLIFDDVPKEGTFLTNFMYFNASSVTVSIPSGWTEFQTVGGGGSNSPICRGYYKVAGASESNSYNFSTSISMAAKWVGVNLVNVNEITPYESFGANSSGASNVTSLNANTIPASAGAIVLVMYSGGGPTTTSDNGYAVLEEDGLFGVHFKQYSSAASQNTTFTWSTTSRARTITLEVIQ